MTTVLHITPHLGGGVGKALSGLICQSRISNSEVRHVVVCLERPEKSSFLDRIVACHGTVIVAPNRSQIDRLVADADIVQLEWWNHPATVECLCSMAPVPLRLLVWCHVSGLHTPTIPPRLMETSHRFLLTSPCSYDASYVSAMAKRMGPRLAVVSSGGGFAGLPEPGHDDAPILSVGYLGSLNFAKLHPNYIDFLAAVDVPGFKVKLIGDLLNREVLERQANAAGRSGMLEFRGYADDVASELRAINVLAYLLNPCHYGTAENALLEAMAMGIVPIVLDNPAERKIVEHLQTGLVVRSRREFADAIQWLSRNPAERSRIGKQAAAEVRKRYGTAVMEAGFRAHYASVMSEEKRPAPFQEIFGTTPDEWFLSCQADRAMFGANGEFNGPVENLSSYNLVERHKGSVFHYLEYFPEVARLRSWARRIEVLQ